MSKHEDQIKQRAHQLWERDGGHHGRDVEYWLKAEHEIAGDSANEGEGNVTAAREYNEETQKFVKSGKVGAKAKEAAAALDGPEADDLLEAEKIGKSHSHGEDPALRKPGRTARKA